MLPHPLIPSQIPKPQINKIDLSLLPIQATPLYPLSIDSSLTFLNVHRAFRPQTVDEASFFSPFDAGVEGSLDIRILLRRDGGGGFQ